MQHRDTTSEPLPYAIRPARPGDEASLFGLIRELARFAHLEPQLVGSAEALGHHLFGERSYAEALLAEAGGEAIGFALFFPTYSTFLTRPGLYLEDLFVRESHRGKGVGHALLSEVARIATQRGAGRLEWSVLDWNAKAITFYERFGARVHSEWRLCRVVL